MNENDTQPKSDDGIRLLAREGELNDKSYQTITQVYLVIELIHDHSSLAQ